MKMGSRFSSKFIVFSIVALSFVLTRCVPASGNYDDFTIYLTPEEKSWINIIEKNHQIRVHYIGGLQLSDEDSVCFIRINCQSDPRFYKSVKRNIEAKCREISLSYLRTVKEVDHPRYIRIDFFDGSEQKYSHHVPMTNRPDERRCVFDVGKRQVVPQIERLEILGFAYRYIDERRHELTKSHLGGFLSKAAYFRELQRKRKFQLINSNDFKGIPDCEEHRTAIHQFIKISGARLHCHYNFVFHHDQEICARITYYCYPKSPSFGYANLVERLTCKPRNPSDMYVEEYSVKINREYLNPDFLEYKKELFGVLVTTKADTTSIPWVIEYETSVDKLKYFSDIDYRFEEQ